MSTTIPVIQSASQAADGSISSTGLLRVNAADISPPSMGISSRSCVKAISGSPAGGTGGVTGSSSVHEEAANITESIITDDKKEENKIFIRVGFYWLTGQIYRTLSCASKFYFWQFLKNTICKNFPICQSALSPACISMEDNPSPYRMPGRMWIRYCNLNYQRAFSAEYHPRGRRAR